jgi:predicted Fe-Mo cluster-binding NifX family protein
MRICIPTDDNKGLQSRVSNHFGGASFFTVFDTEKDRVDVVRNDEMGHGQRASEDVGRVTKLNVDAIACQGVGAHAFNALRDSGIQLLLTQDKTVADVVQAVVSRRLRPLSVAEAYGGHQRGMRRRSGVRAQSRSRRRARRSQGRWS